MLMCLIGPPTQGSAYQMLLQAERVVEIAGKSVVGDAQMINMVLDIECQQYVNVQDLVLWTSINTFLGSTWS